MTPQVSGNFVLCCVGSRAMKQNFITEITQSLEELGLDPRSVPLSFEALDIFIQVTPSFNIEELFKTLRPLSDVYQVDMALLRNDSFRKNKKLIVFDMDSTLINAEVIDELAIEAGVGEEVKKITERTMQGELNFDESLAHRVALLKGLEREVLIKVYQRLELNPGVERFLKEVHAKGIKTAIASGGFNFFAELLRSRLNMNYIFSNELEFQGERLTGRIQGEIVNAEAKALILEELACELGISTEEVVAIGDGANDIPMLSKAGLGVAFHAKSKVKEKALAHISYGSMASALYFLGFSGEHRDELI